MKNIVYLRMKKEIKIEQLQTIKLHHIGFISTSSTYKEELEKMVIYHITKKDKDIVVIDSFMVVEHLNLLFPNLEFRLIGPSETIIRLDEIKKSPSILVVSFIWILLFIGTSMTIMNFHYDVSMQEVQQKLHYLFTGKHSEHPLWIQIPYSLGLGVGMLLFFNHWFKKKFNEEPSPLEVELFNYQQDLDDYLIHYENDLNDKDDLT